MSACLRGQERSECLEAFNLRRVDAVKKGVAIIELGIDD